jgi:putative transposase
MPSVQHRQSRYLNNGAEVSHQLTRRRERQMQRFKSVRHSRIHNHFQLRRHRLPPNDYRATRHAAFRIWHEISVTTTAA